MNITIGTPQKISIDKAKTDKLFYFVANVVIYRESDGRCLILKRHSREKVHAGKYCVPGGKLEWKDMDVNNPTRTNGNVLDYENAVEDLLAREAFEEAGVKIGKKLTYLNSVSFIRPDEIPVVLVKFAAKYVSGDIKLEEGGFTDYAWVNAEEVKNYLCIDGISEEIAQAIVNFASNNIEQKPKVGVGVMLFKNGKIFLQKRKGTHGSGEWAYTGGHLEHLETFEDCAIRETREESGMEITNIRHHFMSNVMHYAPDHYVHIGVIADWKSGEPQVLEPDKATECGWFDLDNLPTPMMVMAQQGIDKYRAGNRGVNDKIIL